VGSEVVGELLSDEGEVGSSLIALVECNSGIARAVREGRATRSQARQLVNLLDTRWLELAIVDLDEDLARHAGNLAHSHELRAGDAIHLAAGIRFQGSAQKCTFGTWDSRLWGAAEAEGFTMVPAEQP
jgi:hypothetical protein